MDLKRAIGKLVAQYRKQKKITQGVLAEKCFVDIDYISKIERGLRQPSLSTLLNILDELDVSYGDFFTAFEKRIKSN